MRVLVYYFHNPWPPRSGTQRRCLQVLTGLIDAGSEVYFASSNPQSHPPWTPAAIQELKDLGIRDVFVFSNTRAHRVWQKIERRWRQTFCQRLWFDQYHVCSHWMRWWFRWCVKRTRPDALLISYACYDHILSHRRHRGLLRVIDMQDLLSRSDQMRAIINGQAEHYLKSGDASEYLDETIPWANSLEPAAEELAIYDQYDAVITISPDEQECLASRLRHARAILLPMDVPPVPLANTYNGPAMFVASGNPYNRQGLTYFIQRVLPNVLQECPDFRLDVIGDINIQEMPSAALNFLGFVEDINSFYQHAAFSICPVFSGTGQQVKLVEAMACGLPVVALSKADRGELLRHETSGLIAADAATFAAHVIRLWHDRTLCRKLGMAARETIVNRSGTFPSVGDILASAATTKLPLRS
jgi:glycosyltransferase involved in cell wall biosynthesis